MLFIVSDDMNTALDCYGHPLVQTPHIARLAARGVRFDRAYCQFPLCNPSRASFLSGRRPDSTRVYTLQTPVRRHIENAVFLPELFRRNSYFTAHAGKVFHTGEAMEDPRSWDEELREFGKQPPAKAVIESEKAQGPIGHSMEWMTLRSKDEETPDGAVARRAVEMMEKSVRAGKPFFVAAGFRRPHSPYAAPKRYFDSYPREQPWLRPASTELISRLSRKSRPTDWPPPEIRLLLCRPLAISVPRCRAIFQPSRSNARTTSYGRSDGRTGIRQRLRLRVL